jgi:hypothetical protein
MHEWGSALCLTGASGWLDWCLSGGLSALLDWCKRVARLVPEWGCGGGQRATCLVPAGGLTGACVVVSGRLDWCQRVA